MNGLFYSKKQGSETLGELLLQTWLREDLHKQGYVGEDLEWQFNRRIKHIPKSLQELAEEALFRQSAKLPLQLYIESLRDKEEHVQLKRDALSRFLQEAKQQR
jgi:hypothetical protein